jgi:ribose transport system substrate-binding protein
MRRASRSVVAATIACAALAILGFAAGDQGPAGAQAPAPSNAAVPLPSTPIKRYTILVTPKSVGVPFWETVHLGASTAAKRFGVSIEWKGTTNETDIAGQTAIIEDYITRHVDGIVMAATSAKGMSSLVTKAQNAGIKIVTIDSGVEPNTSLSYLATNNVKGGELLADALADQIGRQGKVALLDIVPGAASGDQRRDGFKAEIKKYPKVQLVYEQYDNADTAKGLALAEDALTSHPDLAGIAVEDGPGAVGVGQALQTKNLAGKVKFVTFDFSSALDEDLRNNVAQGLVIQAPFTMGYLGVQSVIDALQGKSLQKQVDTGVTLVTKSNYQSQVVQRLLFPEKYYQ